MESRTLDQCLIYNLLDHLEVKHLLHTLDDITSLDATRQVEPSFQHWREGHGSDGSSWASLGHARSPGSSLVSLPFAQVEGSRLSPHRCHKHRLRPAKGASGCSHFFQLRWSQSLAPAPVSGTVSRFAAHFVAMPSEALSPQSICIAGGTSSLHPCLRLIFLLPSS